MSMTKADFSRAASAESKLNVGFTFQHEFYDIGDAVVKSRALRGLDSVAARYPIHRQVRCAVPRKLEDVFDDLALQTVYAALRLSEGSLLLDSSDVFIRAQGWRNAEYCSCSFGIWTSSVRKVEETRDELYRIVGKRYAPSQMFTIDWHFMDARSGLRSASFDELWTDVLHDEAYPTLGMAVPAFIQRYLAASETVLILQGPPGTGKTRLVRAILGAISARKQGDSAQIMYTADQHVLQNDEIFVDFITGSHDAFVIEDADHLLLARSNGNKELHRFLAVADGVVRAQGRKIIFTTNLPNISDIDDALLRPGRCFATVKTRGLQRAEAAALVSMLVSNANVVERIVDHAFANASSMPVAGLYRAVERYKV